MEDYVIIDQLEELAKGFGIQFRYEPISFEEETINSLGGLCILRGEHLLIINSKATEKEKIKVFVQALRNFGLNQIYVKPAIRALLEGRDSL
ncbi:MAG: hypothetical protein OS130_01230 [Thermodesulfobacteriota bacterium]|jgi:hypothetical protein|nr:MAG: hypothetical protein OS130_01230 [Thermodesulfobacteriota bacterium]